MPEPKRCSRCKCIKSLENFYYRKDRKCFISSCKDCFKYRMKISYNSDKKKNYNQTYKKTKEYWNSLYLKKYNLSLNDYEKLLNAQKGLCASCEHSSNKKLVVDHCHITLKVRGLLCSNCNTALGLLKDSLNNINKLAKYKEKSLING